MLVPPSHPQHDAHDGEHDRHLDQDADHGCERRTRLKAKERDRGGDRQLEKIRGADQRRWTGGGTPSARLRA